MTRTDLLWLLACGVLSSAYCVTAAWELGPTFDEPFYVAKGLEFWRTGSHRALMRAGTMPLPVDVQTLPVWAWEKVRGEPFDPVSDLPHILPVARSANLVFWWLLLFYAVRLGNLWGGPTAGRWAAATLAVEPNLLAHASLATTDIALTAGVLAAVYHFAAGGTGWRRWAVPGVAAGVAVACKASAVAFVPLAWAVVWMSRNLPPRPPSLRGKGEQNTPPPSSQEGGGRGGVGFLARLVVVAVVTLFVVVGTDWCSEPSFVKWADTLPSDDTGNALRTTAEHLRIFPNAAEGIVQQIKHNSRGHGAYVLGEWHDRAVWWYFPVVLSAKLPEPLLVLLAGLLLVRPKSLFNPAGLIAVVLLLFSLSCRVQLGLRLVFPLVAMLNVAAVVALTSRDRHEPRPRGSGKFEDRSLAVAARWLLVLLTAFISLANAPHGLRYCNHLWGGRERAAEVLTDSNHDWGQGLPELRRWWEQKKNLTPPSPLSMYGEGGVQRAEPPVIAASLRATGGGTLPSVSRQTKNVSPLNTPLSIHGEGGRGGEVRPPPLRLWYYGTDPTCLLPPFELVQVNQMPNPGVEEVRRLAGGGYFAVGESFFTACPDRRPGTLAVLDWLKSQTPVAVVGTFRVYWVEP